MAEGTSVRNDLAGQEHLPAVFVAGWEHTLFTSRVQDDELCVVCVPILRGSVTSQHTFR